MAILEVPRVLTRVVLLPGLLVSGLFVAGCAAPGVTTPKTCGPDEITYADPWIAFESPADSGDTLKVGDRTWVGHGATAADVTVEGDGAVELTDERAATVIACGTEQSFTSWLEVTATRPGQVRLTFAGGADPLEFTIEP